MRNDITDMRCLRLLQTAAKAYNDTSNLPRSAIKLREFIISPIGKNYIITTTPQTLFQRLRDVFPQYVLAWLLAIIKAKYTINQIVLMLDYWIERNTTNFEVQCITSTEITNVLKKQITDKIKERYEMARTRYLVNPALKGGIKLLFPSFVLDNSLQSSLRRLKQKLSLA